MIDQFVEDAKKEIGKKISEQFDLSAAEMDTLFRISKNALQDQVKSSFFKGKIDPIVDLFTKEAEHPPIVTETIVSIKNKLQIQLNLSEERAQEISNSAVLAIISFFKAKFKASGNSEDLRGIAAFLGMGGMATIFSIFDKSK
jgi:hypothetical protein